MWPKGVEHYDLLEKIGHGSTSIVYRAKQLSNGTSCAIKTFELADKPDNFKEMAQKEIEMLFSLDHPYIIKLWVAFFTNSQLWMVMPIASLGSLKDLMMYAHPKGFPEKCVTALLRQVLKGLEYLHGRRELHRDIKAGNLFLSSDGVCLIGDFGVASQLAGSEARNTFAGTPCWMAPEVMKQTKGYTTSADIWSLGITAIELATGDVPYSNMHPMEIVANVLQNDPPNVSKSDFSRNFRKLIRVCLMKNPSERASAAELLKQSTIKKAKNSDYIKKIILDEVSPIWERTPKSTKKDVNNVKNDNVALMRKKFRSGNFGKLIAQVEQEVAIK